ELLNNLANARQLTAFREIASVFSGVPASLANSSGIFLGSQFQFDMVRPGAALYGINPTPEADNPMKPVVELRARIVQIRNVERGETVGYGGTWTARRPTKLAIVAAGYADGYFRAASANDGTRGAEVVVAGKRCPIAGRVSMDLMAVDITDLDKSAARRGHMATLIGEGITVDVVALQEQKAADAEFPSQAIDKAGYGAVWRGQKTWNGVAILARHAEPILIRDALPVDAGDREARYIEAAVRGIVVTSIYLPNG